MVNLRSQVGWSPPSYGASNGPSIHRRRVALHRPGHRAPGARGRDRSADAELLQGVADQGGFAVPGETHEENDLSEGLGTDGFVGSVWRNSLLSRL